MSRWAAPSEALSWSWSRVTRTVALTLPERWSVGRCSSSSTNARPYFWDQSRSSARNASQVASATWPAVNAAPCDAARALASLAACWANRRGDAICCTTFLRMLAGERGHSEVSGGGAVVVVVQGQPGRGEGAAPPRCAAPRPRGRRPRPATAAPPPGPCGPCCATRPGRPAWPPPRATPRSRLARPRPVQQAAAGWRSRSPARARWSPRPRPAPPWWPSARRRGRSPANLPCGGRAIPSGPGGQPRRGAGHPGVGGDVVTCRPWRRARAPSPPAGSWPAGRRR